MIKLLVLSGLLAVSNVCGIDQEVDYSGVENRVILENNVEWSSPFEEASSPEMDSSEAGVTPGARNTSCLCGWANRPKARIVGGKEYDRFEYPFITGVSYSTNRYNPHCGGMMITLSHVLTAAHCTVEARGSIGLYVTLAEHERGWTLGSYAVKVDKLIQHPGYNPTTFKDDISLLALKTPVKLSLKVGPACFPTQNSIDDLAGKYVRIIGWGADKWGGSMKYKPQKIDTKVVDKETCSQVWYNVADNPATQICTLSPNKSPCQGDSGGPVVYLDPETNRYSGVGVVSFGPFCMDFKPSVQTFIPAYKDWILKNIDETSSGAYICT